jgi:hypothetical protein
MIAIAGTQIVTGGASAPPALPALPELRTITNGVLSFLEGAHAKAA